MWQKVARRAGKPVDVVTVTQMCWASENLPREHFCKLKNLHPSVLLTE